MIDPVSMTERLIDAAVYYETAQGIYNGPARKELFEARAAIEAALSGISGPGHAGGDQAAGGGGEGAEKVSELATSTSGEVIKNDNLLAAAILALNYITNTESEFGITLKCGDALRAAIAKAAGS